MKNWLEKQFRLSEFNTDIKTELLAGLTTFVTMAYVLATIPNILAGAGYDKHTTLTVMILLIIVTSCAMALFTNRPFALAPGLGSVGIIASMITNEGVSMPIAAGVIFWSGVLFIIISFFGLREAVVRVIPVSLKQSVSAGIGLLIGRYQMMQAFHGRVLISHVNEQIERILELSGIEKHIRIEKEETR